MQRDDHQSDRLRHACDRASSALLSEATGDGHWIGELSSSPLSTATAVAALQLVRRDQPNRSAEFEALINHGLQWLAEHQNDDGGWGDTLLSLSNISTTTLAYASFHMVQSDARATHDFREGEAALTNKWVRPQATACRAGHQAQWKGVRPICWAKQGEAPAEPRSGDSHRLGGCADVSPSQGVAVKFDEVIAKAKAYIDRQGSFDSIRKRYGKDHTFSVPILTQCALAGLIPWQELTPLPFELGWLPHWFYKWIRLPVVSYALPALIAIGQVRHYHAPSWNPLIRLIRSWAVKPTLRKLESIQPESGGFLEATPLTSFVTMSLASMKLSDDPVARHGVEFLKASVRPDGSWPIDTNLATWVTTLSVNALTLESLPKEQVSSLVLWLLNQQHRIVHRYTNAAPGGWAWTDLSGGVPDADDTPGAILALLKLDSSNPNVRSATTSAVTWLLDLQNADGGWPTFCRGWGALPFDRSTPDLTAHTLRAFRAWLTCYETDATYVPALPDGFIARVYAAVERGFAFLERTQRSDGAWIPLWFGNQFVAADENPVYGVARALPAFHAWDRMDTPAAHHAAAFLVKCQNSDGGWGGAINSPSSIEETALAVEAILSITEYESSVQRGLDWICEHVETDRFRNPAPIGLYFAKLWYFERLYPIIFTVSALSRTVEAMSRQPAEKSATMNQTI